jgi:hypothetical protein
MFIEQEASPWSLTMRGLVEGVGINDAPYIVNLKDEGQCPYYNVWTSMLKRCYNTNLQDKNPTYKGCSVCSEWITFTKFKAWMESQDWKDKCLDKDLLVEGNKLYSPTTCIFVTQQINKLMLDCAASRGSCVVGVNWRACRQKFRATCKVDGKSKHIGYYLTEAAASFAYRNFKGSLIKDIALKQEDIRLREALLRIAKDYINEASQ